MRQELFLHDLTEVLTRLNEALAQSDKKYREKLCRAHKIVSAVKQAALNGIQESLKESDQ
jgi:hypothetical protein